MLNRTSIKCILVKADWIETNVEFSNWQLRIYNLKLNVVCLPHKCCINYNNYVLL